MHDAVLETRDIIVFRLVNALEHFSNPEQG